MPDADNARQTPAPFRERRAHRRLELRLPVVFRQADGCGEGAFQAVTQNVSTGGLYFELESPGFRSGDRLSVELTIPPADGVSAYPCRATCDVEVLRSDRLAPAAEGATEKFGVAARLLSRLRIE